MTATKPSNALMTTLALATNERVAGMLDAPIPALVLAGDCTTVRFLNAAAAAELSIKHALSILGQPAPLDEAVTRHILRIQPTSPVGRQSSERIRYYRGIKPIVLALTLENLGEIAGETAILITLPELKRSGQDSILQATLALYAGDDDLITAFGDDDVLALAGHQAVLEEAPAEIEALADRPSTDGVEETSIATAAGTRPVMIARVHGTSTIRRLLYIGALEPFPVKAVVAGEDHSPSVGLQEEATPFVFSPNQKPQRFTWALDTDGRFTDVSSAFAATLGRASAPRLGCDWLSEAARLDLDHDGKIGRLIAACSPWHGQTVLWPVEGEALRVPVELTGIATRDVTQQHVGMHGFGVIWPAAAQPDPLATGLVLGKPALSQDPNHALIETNVAPEMDDTVIGPIESLQTDLVAPEAVEHQQADAEIEPPPRFPRLVTPDVEGESDAHFVSLMPAAHISPETLRLTGAERNAFRQIAEALGARFEGDDEPVQAPDAENKSSSDAEGSIRFLTSHQIMDHFREPPDPEFRKPVLSDAEWRAETATAGDTRLIDRLPIAIGLAQKETVIHVNSPFLALTGYDGLDDLNEAGGLDGLFAGPHAAKGWADDLSGHPIPLVTRSGRVIPVEAHIAKVPWGDGTALLLTLQSAERRGASVAGSVSGDLTERLEVSQLRVRELEAVLATASDGLLMLNADGIIVSANHQAESLFGCQSGQLAGRQLFDFIAMESRRAAADYLDGVARNGIGSLLTEGLELTALAGGDRPITVFATIARTSTSPEPLFAAVFRDISRWKTSEEELLVAKRRAEVASVQKSEFLAKISHEIRTPLNAIIGFSEVMLGERFGAIGVERYKDYLRDIQSSGTHIMSLVNDLLDLSKVEAGKLDLKFESVQLVDILGECVALMQPQANRERIIIRASLAQNLPPVVADQRSIRQIVLNLLSNAIKFTPAGGQVIVSAALEDTNEVVIRVRDTGYGMSPGDIEIALEPFRQVHQGRGRVTQPGTGLGLPLTKALVEANRAALKIDSAVNQGTLVQVTFPAPRVLAAE